MKNEPKTLLSLSQEELAIIDENALDGVIGGAGGLDAGVHAKGFPKGIIIPDFMPKPIIIPQLGDSFPIGIPSVVTR
jgi:hypothetical protein